MSTLRRFWASALGVLALLSCGGVALGQEDLLQRKVNAAVDRGVDFLKKRQQKEGNWDIPPTPGLTAMAAWTLLQCGLPPDDDVVQKAAALVRKAALGENKVYHLALMIFFLADLNDPADVPLIQALGLRLLAGQQRTGSWIYHTPEVTEAEQRVITDLVDARRKRIAAKSAPPDNGKVLPPVLQGEAVRLATRPLEQMGRLSGDNSNTQFAMLALWVARRYGVPTERALAMVEAWFRRTQHADGSWWYIEVPLNVIPQRAWRNHAMTCAGLLGLALGHANDRTRVVKQEIFHDPQVRAGFARLSKVLDGSLDPNDPNGPLPPKVPGVHPLYFLWSLERVAVVYDFQKLGGTDWYLLGVTQLLGSQSAEGAWAGGFGEVPDTCLALLFLRKVNVAQDLTKNLRKVVKKTPGPLEDLPDLIPLEDKTKKPAPKQTPAGPKQSSRLPTPASTHNGEEQGPGDAARTEASPGSGPLSRTGPLPYSDLHSLDPALSKRAWYASLPRGNGGDPRAGGDHPRAVLAGVRGGVRQL